MGVLSGNLRMISSRAVTTWPRGSQSTRSRTIWRSLFLCLAMTQSFCTTAAEPLPTGHPLHSDPTVRARVLYASGHQEISAAWADPNSYRLNTNHIEFVRDCRPLAEWIAKRDALGETGRHYSPEEEHELAEIIAHEIKQRETEKITLTKGWTLSSVIYRYQTDNTPSYTNTVHRDLSEDALENMKAHSQQEYFFNAWIPRETVREYPLGLITPSTVCLEEEVAGFMGLDNDRTGLQYSPTHQWIYHPNLGPGDFILWHSEIVYHSALHLTEAPTETRPEGAIRNSLDMRIYYHTHKPDTL